MDDPNREEMTVDLQRKLRHAGCMFLLALVPATAAGQGGTSLTLSGGLALSNQYAEGGREGGPALGLSVGRSIGTRVGLELALGTAVFGMSEVIPTCLPENRSACHARVIAPGQLVSGSLRLLARPVAALTLLAGGGVTRSTSFSSENTNSESSSTALHAGIRVHPFRSDGRGPGLELIATRFSREIGRVRWLIAPAMVWRF